MKIIKHIVEFIDEEMDGVCDYIKFAEKHKGTEDGAYTMVLEIINQEIKHIEMWHEFAVKEIMKMRVAMKQSGKEVPPYMLEMWEEEHEKYTERMWKIRYKLDMLKK